ncbi:MAG: hypothetical protein LAO24_05995 [Acidobacteriia bacterium]|nr:hypothetical protein [Terriglobia bacterium]
MFAVPSGKTPPGAVFARILSRLPVFLVVSLLLSIGIFLVSSSSAQVSVTTQRYDNSRSGLDLSESLLNPTNVNSTTFGRLFSQPVDGAIVGHPLFLPGISIPGLGTHNVVYAATMHDSVYAFDAASNSGSNAQPLWHVSFTNAGAGVTSVPIADQACGKVTAFTEIGVLPAMVIDSATGTLYAVAKTEESGSFVHRLHALDITTGQEKFGGPVQIKGSVVSGGVTFAFKDRYQMARPGLVLVKGVVYVTFGGEGCKFSPNAVGWVMAYNASNLQQLGVFTTNPRDGYGVGIWQGGVGPAADSAGNLYFATGDGPYDADTGGPHYGDSVLKLNLGTTLGVASYFTPNNERYLTKNDLDLGSGGVLMLPDQAGSHPHEMIAIGKEGSINVIDRDNLGGFNPGGNSQIPQFLAFVTGEVAGVPLYWNNLLFVGGQGFPVQAYALTNGQMSVTPIYESTLSYSNPNGLILSANGNSNAVLWAMDGQGSATKMFAFDALNLNKLYSTIDNATRDSVGGAPHFVTPIVANGRVYVGGTSKLAVYGLFRVLPVASGSGQTGTVNTTLPTMLKVQATDPYGGNVSGLSVTFSDAGAGGSFSSSVVKTDVSGFASTSYTLPKTASTVTITASLPGFNQATFSEVANAGAPALIKTHGGFNQTAPINTPLPASISAAVKDAFNNAVPGVVVTFSDGGAGGAFSSTTATTNSSGWADVNYTTPGVPGVIYVTATVSGVATGAKFKETVMAQ